MAQQQQVRKRILSVKNTSKLTKAMEMISATRMKRSIKNVEMGRSYAEAIVTLMNNIARIGTPDDSPLFRKPTEIKNSALIVIGMNKGFVGVLESKLLLAVHELVEQQQLSSQSVIGISLRAHGEKILETVHIPPAYQFEHSFDPVRASQVEVIVELLITLFTEQKIDQCYLCYSQYAGQTADSICIEKLLPFSFTSEQVSVLPHTVEPSKEAIIPQLVKNYLTNRLVTGLLQSAAAEHAARMVSMKTATDNAQTLSKQLTHVYNKTRQQSITQQMIEIINSATS